MSLILSILVDGVAYGMILFMISVGLSITMGLMRIINLAHGGFALLGGAAVHLLTTRLDVAFIPAFLVAVLAVVLVSVLLERLLYRHIYGFNELGQVLATIGIVFIMIATVNLFLGSTILPLGAPAIFTTPIDLGFRTLPFHRLVVIISGLLVLAGLWLLMEKTRFGIYLRAAVDNRIAAASLGINTPLVYLVAFATGAGLAAVGGILGAELLPIEAYYPLRYMVLFLIVVSVGGLGSISGSFLASISLGILDTAGRYLLPGIGTIFFFVAIVVLLALRPNGLMGKAQ
ncbi:MULTISPECIES: branched-chain amino acid ABC transporter permease [Rhizobium]|uniref:Branched-chain amino acid ABC transporter permease n=1 Tax=Rhizobium leguminosarum bv. viciae TaxID=387 RepID=A0A8G2IT85_RHILV|nr:branched-chain amino acid ABC transporter permease [Rhizobium leguminosarum]NKK11206.1 branched-chain amino acid ABC transporter permease [Rhizobium leguminosarum bv. viciae]NKK25032.1 branched-chain amino acid ABC transporter permease [Rhizobium leguminosarum bv. viciae]TBX85411.1 branched-chain amino acid ABC transporter permease [Rhizobium leguminosarum bv. viciae]TBY78093.1 branched-chain amino acid ABC transporter permease [Rhizobium leguminosarum bv. viciae]TBZ09875.1 branched-chain a